MGTLGDAFRLMRAGLVLARHDALLPRAWQGAIPGGFRLLGFLARFGLPLHEESRGRRLARALEQLGPAYVKLGQFLATRGDILSDDVVDGLASLKDSMPPFAQEKAQALLEEQLGERAKDIDLGKPVAAASVAQVHKARLADGSEVAVKLLRPGVEKRIRHDVAAMRLGAQWAEKLFPKSKRLEPNKFVETVARSLQLELDLRMEASACDELGELSGQVDGVKIPRVIWELTAEKVLGLQWLDGVPLTDLKALDDAGFDRKQLASNVTTSFLELALDHGVFHADLHEGNIFAMPGNALGLVDFGIVGRLGRDSRRYLAEILYGFIRRDYRRVAEVHFEAGYVPKSHLVDDFAQAIRAVGEPVFGKLASDVSMGNLLLQLFTITARFDMHLRPELVLLQKTMVQVEGVARTLYPDHDLWGVSTPVIERWIKRELGPEGQMNDMVDDFLDARDAFRKLPELIDTAHAEIKKAQETGWNISEDSARKLARARGRIMWWRDVPLALGGLSLMALALKSLLG